MSLIRLDQPEGVMKQRHKENSGIFELSRMAFSQVDVASSQSLGCILRDRNCLGSNVESTHAIPQKNVKVFVKDDHVRDRTSHHPQPSDESSRSRIDSWLKSPKSNQKDSNSPRTLKNSKTADQRRTKRVLDRWPAVSVHNPRFDAQNVPISNQFVSSKENSETFYQDQRKKSARAEKVGALSLVQMWEERLRRSSGASSSQSRSMISVEPSSGPSVCESLPSYPSEMNANYHGEKERIRVADIVWKLSSDQEKACNCKTGSKEMLQYRSTRSPCSSDRISLRPLRGRQAFVEFLAKVEAERRLELKSLSERQCVSKFGRRGRLRAIIRARSLQRCVAIQDQHRPKPMAREMSLQPPASTVKQIRTELASPSASSTFGQNSDVHDAEESRRNAEDEEPENPYKNQCLDTQENASNCEKETMDELETKDHQLLGCLEPEEIIEETCSDFWGEKLALEDEQEWNDFQGHYYDTNYCDWIDEVSRPRSYWEHLRKERYLEIFNTPSANQEISKLLERRRVSDFLESDMRERIEKLMISRTQRRLLTHGNELESAEEEQGSSVVSDAPSDPAIDGLSQSYSRRTFSHSPQSSWSSRNPSLDTELILELRTQIRQLQHEMLDLRRSVESFVDVQFQLRESVKQDSLRNHRCCHCNDDRIASRSYSCSRRICMCLKCSREAAELQELSKLLPCSCFRFH